MNNLSPLRKYAIDECRKDGVQAAATDLEEAVSFLQKMSDPGGLSLLELEMTLMHAAYLVDNENSFVDNYNVRPALYNSFIDHVSLAVSSDSSAWCRKLDSSSFWDKANRRVANLIWNWFNSTLDNPRTLV